MKKIHNVLAAILVFLFIIVTGLTYKVAFAQPDLVNLDSEISLGGISNQLQKDAKSLVKQITYIRDKRTGVCFAVFHAYRHSAISWVPCPTVAKFLK